MLFPRCLRKNVLQTISLTTSFFLAMMLNPDAQARAQVEIDRVVGRDRLPTFADRPSLPYTEALVTELLRWAPPIPVSEYFYQPVLTAG